MRLSSGTLTALVVDPVIRAYGANIVLRGSRLCHFTNDVLVLWRLLLQVPEH